MKLEDLSPEELTDRYRRAIKAGHFVLMPDGKQFMIMWRFYEQCGVRHLETGEQYAIRYEDMHHQRIMPLILCPVDIGRI